MEDVAAGRALSWEEYLAETKKDRLERKANSKQ